MPYLGFSVYEIVLETYVISCFLSGKHILRPLNRVQQKAIFKTMMAEEYVLIRGMPGKLDRYSMLQLWVS